MTPLEARRGKRRSGLAFNLPEWTRPCSRLAEFQADGHIPDAGYSGASSVSDNRDHVLGPWLPQRSRHRSPRLEHDIQNTYYLAHAEH